jgi:hypothetical protein
MPCKRWGELYTGKGLFGILNVDENVDVDVNGGCECSGGKRRWPFSLHLLKIFLKKISNPILKWRYVNPQL